MKLLMSTITLFVLLVSGAYANDSLSKAELYSIFDQVNGFDIETATLGVTQSDNRAVRELAAMVLRDHSMVIQMARDLAKQQNISYEVDSSNPSAMTHQKVLKRLHGLSGVEFDKAYLKHELEFHSSAIEAVKTVLIPAAKGTALESLLNNVLPGFEHHLEHTKKTANKLGVI